MFLVSLFLISSGLSLLFVLVLPLTVGNFGTFGWQNNFLLDGSVFIVGLILGVLIGIDVGSMSRFSR